jgi:ABC-type dipeptide/oligopeptide/nickel transport system permease component
MELQITPLQGRIDGWGPEPITGFFVLDSLIVADWESLQSALSHLMLPTLTLAFPAMATIVRFTRAGFWMR